MNRVLPDEASLGQRRGGGEPQPAGHTPLNAPQNTLGLLGSQGTLLAHGQLVTHQYSQVPLHRAALQQLHSKPVLVRGVVPPQVQDPALALVELVYLYETYIHREIFSTAFELLVIHSFIHS